jgi:hypothetical protein
LQCFIQRDWWYADWGFFPVRVKNKWISLRYHGQLRLPFSLLNNQKPGFFRLIGVEDDADEETQALHDQETGRSVPLHFDPAPSRYCNRGMVCLPVRIWSHAYDLWGKANPRTMWLWESMRSFFKAVPSCYNFWKEYFTKVKPFCHSRSSYGFSIGFSTDLTAYGVAVQSVPPFFIL